MTAHRNDLPEWIALRDLAAQLSHQERCQAQQDNQSNDDMVLSCQGMTADFQNSIVPQSAMKLLYGLADACGLSERRDALFAGEKVNNTEGRAVLHMALRGKADDDFNVDGTNVMADVIAVREKMLSFAENVRTGAWHGVMGDRITDIVNIGIGGSDLGPYMVCEALQGQAEGPSVHFVSNVDGAHLHDVVTRLNPATTLFVITSKTFTTQETLLNADTAKKWMLAALGKEHKEGHKNNPAAIIAQHFVAVSTNADAVQGFGIAADNMFPFWDWVGGRFSLWSSVGLSIALAIGAVGFNQLLAGAAAMDDHFKTAPLDQNIPVVAGLTGVFYRNFMNFTSLAILPYAQRLHLLPSCLQQLEMESNGKARNRQGHPVTYATAPVIFGQAGTNGQHAFYQMLHQGSDVIPADFIGVENVDTDQDHHHILNAHLSAQIEALRDGQSYDAAFEKQGQNELKARHSVFDGGRPAHLYMVPKLDAYYLGMLLALYEHKVFVQGVIWDLNSFDQWGVQLGKDLAQKYL